MKIKFFFRTSNILAILTKTLPGLIMRGRIEEINKQFEFFQSIEVRQSVMQFDRLLFLWLNKLFVAPSSNFKKKESSTFMRLKIFSSTENYREKNLLQKSVTNFLQLFRLERWIKKAVKIFLTVVQNHQFAHWTGTPSKS